MSGQRPSLDDGEVRQTYIAHLRAGMRRGAAAEFMSLRRFETYAYIAEHPEFDREVREAEDAALENVEEAIYQAAVTGNVRAAEIWLGLNGRGVNKPAMPSAPSSGSSQPSNDDDLEARLERLGG